PVGVAAVLGLMLAIPAPPAEAAPAAPLAADPPPKPDEELVEKVRKGIERGVRYLEAQQSAEGNWESQTLNLLAGMRGGVTSLVTLALLNCGVKPEDRSVARALTFLRAIPPEKTYV